MTAIDVLKCPWTGLGKLDGVGCKVAADAVLIPKTILLVATGVVAFVWGLATLPLTLIIARTGADCMHGWSRVARLIIIVPTIPYHFFQGITLQTASDEAEEQRKQAQSSNPS